ncbi:MAG: hypothetical protein H0T46_25830 [Deltaproteobacteria bacterium]|nr:hypothetical protein [Deltaproteobacteria bacterium]
MSNRTIFAIMAAVAVAAIVGLWFAIKGGGDEVKPTVTSAKGSGSGAWVGTQHGPAGGRPLDPSLPTPPGSKPPENPKAYSVNGAIVHDMRSGNHEPFTPSANPAPANNRKLQPTLTKAIADRVRDAMHECVKLMPDGVRGEKPRLEGSINIAIKDKKVLINKADLIVNDVNGDAKEATRQCIAGKTMAITHAAGEEADLESYDINLSFTLI